MASYVDKPQGHGKKKFLSPPKKFPKFYPPPLLRGCPCGDFPSPHLEFSGHFPVFLPLEISHIKNLINCHRNGMEKYLIPLK